LQKITTQYYLDNYISIGLQILSKIVIAVTKSEIFERETTNYNNLKL